jgi:hypothetical protein
LLEAIAAKQSYYLSTAKPELVARPAWPEALGRILGVAVRHQNDLMLNPNLLVMRLVLNEAGLALDDAYLEQFSAYRAALERRLRQDED